MNKLQEFVSVINSKIGCGYVYGGQNAEPLTKEALAALVKKFGRSKYYYSGYSAEKWLGKEYYDCSGLIVYTLRKLGIIQKTADYTSQGIYSALCTPITKKQLKTGDICFRNTSAGIIHCGVYMGNNKVTQARGTSYGVVNTNLFDSFNVFGRLKYFAGDTSDIKITFENSTKNIVEAAYAYELPDKASKSIGSLKPGSAVNIAAVMNGSWYLVNLNGKMGYVDAEAFTNHAELRKALEFLSLKSEIDMEYWYNQAINTKWLDLCFIKIARGFGGMLY